MMTLEELFTQASELYLDQFRAFVAQQRAEGGGTPEVKMEVSAESGLYRRLYRVDFARGPAEGGSIVEMQPDEILTLFGPISASIGDMELHIDALCWDDVVLHHDLTDAPLALDDWFDYWFDPSEKRHDPKAEFSWAIHSLGIEPGLLTIDLGTAPPNALFNLIDVFAKAGAQELRIVASRPAGDPH